MAIYENMPPDGHLNFTERIFTKIKNLFDTKVQTDVPANAIFTDEKVTQTESTTNENYEVLVSGTASTVTTTEGVNKSVSFKYNPNKCAVMEGQLNKATNLNTHAEGYYTTASGDQAHSEGQGTLASGIDSHSEGYYSKATGHQSHAEGNFSYANGSNSHAEGNNTYASGDRSHAEGGYTTASSNSSHAEGYTTYAKGSFSHTEGLDTSAIGNASHAEGDHTYAEGNDSHTEGYGSCATGQYGHAEGYYTKAYGDTSHTEGSYTYASTVFAHAEGTGSSATNIQAHAEGGYTLAAGANSHSEGYYTSVTGGVGAHAEGQNTLAYGQGAHAEGYTTYAQGTGAHSEGTYTTALYNSHAEGQGSYTPGNYGHAEGYKTTAYGESAHAEGSFSYAQGNYSHAEGRNTIASGNYAHSEGYQTCAHGNYSHAEGNATYAGGTMSHTEGYGATATGIGAHAEGQGARATGDASHAEGSNTIANHRAQHVFGQFNIADASTAGSYMIGDYVEIVGNGKQVQDPDTGEWTVVHSNARTLDWNGNEWVAAGVSIDGLSSTTEGETSTIVQTSSAHLQNKSLTLSDITDTITPSETEGEDPTIETETHAIEVTPEDIILDDTWDGSRTSLKEAVTFLGSQSAANKVSKSGDTMTGDLSWNGETGFQSGLYWKEYSYGDKFKIYPHFSGSNDSNYLTIATATGDEGTDPELTETFKFYPSGKFETAGASIDYKGTQATYPMIKFIDNTADAYGNGISIGGGGTTIIGGGESSNAMASSLSGGGNELMYIGNDGDVEIHTNLQNGWASRKTFTFSSGGRLTIPEYCYASYFHQSSGAETPSTGSYFIYCNSDGFFRKSTRLNAAKALTNQAVSSPGYVVSLTDNWGTFGYTTIAQLKSKFGYGNIVGYNIGASGNWWNRAAVIGSTGVMEIGQYIDFHVTSGATSDYNFRFTSLSNGNLHASGSISQGSSYKIKENIEDMTLDEAEKILSLKPVKFDYIEGSKNQMGFIAEDVGKIIPNLYFEEEGNEDDHKMFTPASLNYIGMIPYLVKVCQNQQKRIEDLEAAIKAL